MLKKILTQFLNVISSHTNTSTSLLRNKQFANIQKLFKQESSNGKLSAVIPTELEKLYKASSSIITSILSSRVMASSQTNQASSSSSQESTSINENRKNKSKFSATKEELKARLSPIQFQVTQLKSTERPGSGEYNKFNKKGSYHCIVCDEELFKSDTKFESGCGWPAFFDAASEDRLKFVKDFSLVGSANLLLLASKADLVRTEVLCGNCDAHLGHRFDDGPISKGGKRYCINSAALRFQSADTEN